MAIGAITGAITAGSQIFTSASDLFGGGGDPALPPPLGVSTDQMVAALNQNPAIQEQLKSYILQIGFCDTGSDPRNPGSCSAISAGSVRELAAQVIYLANGAPTHSRDGLGEGFGPEEAKVRSLAERALGQYTPSQAPQQSGFTQSVSGFLGDVETAASEGQAAISGAEAGVAANRASRSSFGGVLPLVVVGAAAFFIARS